jgi:hypothetical protein
MKGNHHGLNMPIRLLASATVLILVALATSQSGDLVSPASAAPSPEVTITTSGLPAGGETSVRANTPTQVMRRVVLIRRTNAFTLRATASYAGSQVRFITTTTKTCATSTGTTSPSPVTITGAWSANSASMSVAGMTCPLYATAVSQKVRVDITAEVKYVGTSGPVSRASLQLVREWSDGACGHVYSALQSYNFPDMYVRHRNFLGELTTVVSDLDKADASFELTPGVDDPTGVSFASYNATGQYLRHQDFRVKVAPNDGTWLFRLDATFFLYTGRADSSAYSLVPVNSLDRVLRHRDDGHIYVDIDPTPNTVDGFDAAGTFRLVSPGWVVDVCN